MYKIYLNIIISFIFFFDGKLLQLKVRNCVFILWINIVTIANPEAKRLYEELIKVRSYNKLIRPVKNNSEKLTVYLGLRLTQLLDVVCIIYVFY
jgi:hypothetical protein